MKKGKTTISTTFWIGLIVAGALILFYANQSTKMQITIPSTFSLEQNKIAYITNYQEMEIKLISTSICPPNAACLVANSATVGISLPGGCGPNADPRCLGPPSFNQRYVLFNGQTKIIQGTSLKLNNVYNNKAEFEVSFKKSCSGISGLKCPTGYFCKDSSGENTQAECMKETIGD